MRPARLVLLAALGGLTACGTPEYRAAYSACEAEWLQKIPPKYEQRMVNKVRYVDQATGRTVCEEENGKTICTAETEKVGIPYIDFETVDVRKSERDAQIRNCAQQACIATFGNPECEPPE